MIGFEPGPSRRLRPRQNTMRMGETHASFDIDDYVEYPDAGSVLTNRQSVRKPCRARSFRRFWTDSKCRPAGNAPCGAACPNLLKRRIVGFWSPPFNPASARSPILSKNAWQRASGPRSRTARGSLRSGKGHYVGLIPPAGPVQRALQTWTRPQ